MNFPMAYGSADMMFRMLYDFVEMNRKHDRESHFDLENLEYGKRLNNFIISGIL